MRHAPGHVLVVDSLNIHRLIIDRRYLREQGLFGRFLHETSRYAKCKPAPSRADTPISSHLLTHPVCVKSAAFLAELNSLELQFLLLNDFRLAVPVEVLEAYETCLRSSTSAR